MLPSENMNGSKVVADKVSNITRPSIRRLQSAVESRSLTRIFRIYGAQRQAQPPRTGELRQLVINCRWRVAQPLGAKRIGVGCSALFGPRCSMAEDGSDPEGSWFDTVYLSGPAKYLRNCKHADDGKNGEGCDTNKTNPDKPYSDLRGYPEKKNKSGNATIAVVPTDTASDEPCCSDKEIHKIIRRLLKVAVVSRKS